MLYQTHNIIGMAFKTYNYNVYLRPTFINKPIADRECKME